MNVEAYDVDSLRKMVRILEYENRLLKDKLKKASIPYDEVNPFEEKIESAEKYDPDQGERIVNPSFISEEMAIRFFSMFWGREDVYARRGKNGGYFPQCDNRWNDRLCPKQRKEKVFCDECENTKWTRLDVKKIIAHLLGFKEDGSDVIGVYPLLPNGTCRFIVFDFDNHEKGRKYKMINKVNIKDFQWIREPKSYSTNDGCIEITTEPHTDLWQRTYYHFRNDNAPVLQMETDEKFFSFTVRTDFRGSKHRFDQCGVVMYLDSENWLKGSVEFENEEFQHLGSVVTNHGYSDWATTAISADVKTMWYRFSRRQDDYCIECSRDGEKFSQMRICHMWEGAETIRFGIYACSPEDSSFTAVFTDMMVTECMWKAHDGQKPDEEGC